MRRILGCGPAAGAEYQIRNLEPDDAPMTIASAVADTHPDDVARSKNCSPTFPPAAALTT